MTEHEDKAPGVTLWLKNASVAASPVDPKLTVIDLRLTCTVYDLELWESVKKKFAEGLRLYKEADFHIEVMGAMRDEILDLERKNADLKKDLARAVDAREQTTAELEKYKAPFRTMGQALRR